MSLIKNKVDSLFRQLHAAPGERCQNPVTGGWFVRGERGEGSMAAQKRIACRALVAREWCVDHSPPDAPALPVDEYAIAEMKTGGGYSHLFAYFAQSISGRDYVVSGHPPFEVYARGALASPHAPDFFKQNAALTKRFPPRPIYGLGPGLVWKSA